MKTAGRSLLLGAVVTLVACGGAYKDISEKESGRGPSNQGPVSPLPSTPTIGGNGDDINDDGFGEGPSAPGPVAGNPTPNTPTPENPSTPGTPSTPTTPVPTPVDPIADMDPLFGFPKGETQLTALCGRGYADQVTTRLCANPRPQIRSLVDLQRTLGLAFVAGNNQNGQGGNPGFAITGHSSSLVARHVNAINPRAILFTPLRNAVNPGYIAMGFARGEQFVELVARDPQANRMRFFLVAFEQGCNARQGGCNLGELLTPAVESNWTGVSVYDDTDLKNTIMDCMHCHQPAGPASQPMLRMQELVDPWTHWFRGNRASNVLIQDYRAAHGNAETYAGIPGAAIGNSDPADLEDSVRDEGFGNQPNRFNGNNIQNTPPDGTPPAAWQTIYDAAAAGNFIPVPFFGIRVTDPTKLVTATQNYQQVMAGNLPLEAMMDIRHIFLDSALPALTFRPRAGATGQQILVQMCQRCHNATLDQTISRALFDVTKLATMSRAEKDKAIERLLLPKESRRKMPPYRFGELSPEETQLVIEELRK